MGAHANDFGVGLGQVLRAAQRIGDANSSYAKLVSSPTPCTLRQALTEWRCVVRSLNPEPSGAKWKKRGLGEKGWGVSTPSSHVRKKAGLVLGGPGGINRADE